MRSSRWRGAWTWKRGSMEANRCGDATTQILKMSSGSIQHLDLMYHSVDTKMICPMAKVITLPYPTFLALGGDVIVHRLAKFLTRACSGLAR